MKRRTIFVLYIDIFNFIFENKNLEANSRADIELHFFKDVLMQHDTAVITYMSHFGKKWEIWHFKEMSYECIYRYIDYDSLYKQWLFALICKFLCLSCFSFSKTDCKTNHTVLWFLSVTTVPLLTLWCLLRGAETFALISVVLLFVWLVVSSFFLKLLWWSDTPPII